MGGSNDSEPPSKRLKFSDPSTSRSFPSIFPPVLFGASDASVSMGTSKDSNVTTNNVLANNSGVLGCHGRIRREEFVRLITQALFSLGYSRSALLLEEESGVVCETREVQNFRTCILEGDWDTCIKLLSEMLPDGEEFYRAKSLVLEQKVLELLEASENLKALQVLRCELAPIDCNKNNLHKLASLVMCSSKSDLHAAANWSGAGEDSRRQLLDALQKLLPPSLVIPNRRLETLVEQALDMQRANCAYHNSVEQAMSLYADHVCGQDQIPTQVIQILEDHTNEVWYVQFSKDGKRLASASKDTTVIIWEVWSEGNAKAQHKLVGHSKPVSLVSWSPDDSLLLSCGDGIKLWDTHTGACLHTYTKHTESTTSCAWFSDGKRFISGSTDSFIYMWDIHGNELDSWKFTTGGNPQRINDFVMSKDETYLLSICNENQLRILNLQDRSERPIEKSNSIMSLCLSKDGKFVLVNLLSGSIHLYEFPSRDCKVFNEPIYVYSGQKHGRFIIRSSFGGSEESFIVSGSEDAQVYIWHRDTEKLLYVLEGHSGIVNSVSWNPCNPHVFASASDDGTIRLWGVSSNASASSNQHHSQQSPSANQQVANGFCANMSNGI